MSLIHLSLFLSLSLFLFPGESVRAQSGTYGTIVSISFTLGSDGTVIPVNPALPSNLLVTGSVQSEDGGNVHVLTGVQSGTTVTSWPNGATPQISGTPYVTVVLVYSTVGATNGFEWHGTAVIYPGGADQTAIQPTITAGSDPTQTVATWFFSVQGMSEFGVGLSGDTGTNGPFCAPPNCYSGTAFGYGFQLPALPTGLPTGLPSTLAPTSPATTTATTVASTTAPSGGCPGLTYVTSCGSLSNNPVCTNYWMFVSGVAYSCVAAIFGGCQFGYTCAATSPPTSPPTEGAGSCPGITVKD